MTNKISLERDSRRQRAYVSTIGINNLHYKNPWLVMWLSALFPGFGHLFLGSHIKGFIYIIWEIMINIHAKINLAIIYSFTGRFDMALGVLDKRWLLLYSAVYVFIIYDSYRITVELNKQTILAERENIRYKPFMINLLEINYLDKKNPWVAIVWSGMMPGLGHLYNHRLLKGIFIIIWWILITYYSHIAEAIHLNAIGHFDQAKAIVNPNWLLFMPSIHTFAVFDSYVLAVESNKLFEIEQTNFLKDNYQDPEFEMPI